jgi:hypothetical protein
MDRPSLRDVIRCKLDDGTLPTKAPNKIHTGYGSGTTCDACGDTIYHAQAEYELNYPDVRQVRRLHFGCAGLWEALRRKRGFDPAFQRHRSDSALRRAQSADGQDSRQVPPRRVDAAAASGPPWPIATH